METALFNHRIVSVGGFQRLRASPSARATCPVCAEEVFLSAANSVKKTASFNHLPRDDSDLRCSLSYPYHPKYAWLDDVDLETIEHRATTLKATFYQHENLKRAFTFLTSLTGKGAVNSDVFALLLRRADKFDIWRYAGLPVWAVPYILLTFTDFYIRRPGKPTYVVRFIIDKPGRSQLNATWLHPGQCSLVKYFVNKGKADRVFGARQATSNKTHAAIGAGWIKNPLPFSESEFKQLTQDTSWISTALDNLLAEISDEPEVEPAMRVQASYSAGKSGRDASKRTTEITPVRVSVAQANDSTRRSAEHVSGPLPRQTESQTPHNPRLPSSTGPSKLKDADSTSKPAAKVWTWLKSQFNF